MPRDRTQTPELVTHKETWLQVCATWYKYDADRDSHFCKICSAWASDENHITGQKHKKALKNWAWPNQYMPVAVKGSAIINPAYKYYITDGTSPEDNGEPAAWPTQQPGRAAGQGPAQPSSHQALAPPANGGQGSAASGSANAGLAPTPTPGAPPGLAQAPAIPLDSDDETESLGVTIRLLSDAVGEISRRQEEADQRSFGQHEQLSATLRALNEKIAGHCALQESLREVTQMVSMSEVQEVEKIVEKHFRQHIETIASCLTRQSHRFERSESITVAELKGELQKRGQEIGEVKTLLTGILGKMEERVGEVAEVKTLLTDILGKMEERVGEVAEVNPSIQKLRGDVDQMMTAVGELKVEAARQASQEDNWEDADWAKYSARGRK